MVYLQKRIDLWANLTPLHLSTKEIEDRLVETGKTIAYQRAESRKNMMFVQGLMRGSYLIMTGMGRVMGGGMTMLFRTMYTMGGQLIATYSAIASAMAGIPGAQVQAALALAGLGFASAQLAGVLIQNEEFTQQMRGYYMMMHGLGSMVSAMPSW